MTEAQRRAFVEVVLRRGYVEAPFPSLARESVDKRRNALRRDLSPENRREFESLLADLYYADLRFRLRRAEALETYVLNAPDLASPKPSEHGVRGHHMRVSYGLPESDRHLFEGAATVSVSAYLEYAVFPELGEAASELARVRSKLRQLQR